jgi:hypothetical protein
VDWIGEIQESIQNEVIALRASLLSEVSEGQEREQEKPTGLVHLQMKEERVERRELDRQNLRVAMKGKEVLAGRFR